MKLIEPFALEDLGTLALFARVAQLQSFSAAAREMNLAKSAVSKRVALLEARLGVRLLVRTTRRVNLTDAGLRVYEACAQVLQATQAAAAAVQDTAAGERGMIRINAPVAFAQRHLLPLIHLHLQAHPGVEIDLSVDDRMIDLSSGRYDLVVRIGRELSEQSVVARLLARDRLVIVGAPSYFARVGLPRDPRELVHHSCLRYAPRSAGVEWRFKGAGGDAGGPLAVSVRASMTAGDDVTLREAAVAGMGLTIMPRCFVDRELAAGQLRSVLDEQMWQPERSIHALLPEGRLAPSRVRLFAQMLADALGPRIGNQGPLLGTPNGV
jgi:DNA-binding transcriptional LysR family regulator